MHLYNINIMHINTLSYILYPIRLDNTMSTPVYIMIDLDYGRKVVDARDYQQIALNNYIETCYSDAIEYGTDSEACFTISKFDYVSKGLSGEYDDVYNYNKPDGSVLLISRNHSRLSGLCGFLNRVIDSSC